VVSVLDDVTIEPLERLSSWFALPGFSLPYKQTRDHWLRFEAPIFNDGAEP